MKNQIKLIIYVCLYFISIKLLIAQANIPILPEATNWINGLSKFISGPFGLALGGIIIIIMAILCLIKGMPWLKLLYWFLGVAMITQHTRIYSIVQSIFK